MLKIQQISNSVMHLPRCNIRILPTLDFELKEQDYNSEGRPAVEIIAEGHRYIDVDVCTRTVEDEQGNSTYAEETWEVYDPSTGQSV